MSEIWWFSWGIFVVGPEVEITFFEWLLGNAGWVTSFISGSFEESNGSRPRSHDPLSSCATSSCLGTECAFLSHICMVMTSFCGWIKNCTSKIYTVHSLFHVKCCNFLKMLRSDILSWTFDAANATLVLKSCVCPSLTLSHEKISTSRRWDDTIWMRRGTDLEKYMSKCLTRGSQLKQEQKASGLVKTVLLHCYVTEQEDLSAFAHCHIITAASAGRVTVLRLAAFNYSSLMARI